MATLNTTLCPSEEYLQYVRTSGGLVPSDPTGWIFSEFDYADWYALVQSKLMVNLEWQWRELGKVSQPPHVEWGDLSQQVNDAREQVKNLPPPWEFDEMSVDFTKSMGELATKIACLWERVADATKQLSGKIRKPVDKPPKVQTQGMGMLGTIGLVTLLGGGTLAAIMLSRKLGGKSPEVESG